jgi:PAS domain S-box-containing protein
MESTLPGTQVSNDQGNTVLKACVKRFVKEVEPDSPAIYICDRDGYIKFYNKAAVALWGRKPEIGKDLWCGSWKIFTPDGTPASFEECPMAKAMKSGISIRGEEILIERPDGKRLNVMPHPDPIFDSEGQVVGAINILVDITRLRENQN